MRYISIILLAVVLFACKKDKTTTPEVNGTINIDVQNHDITLAVSKISYTDSLILKFSNDGVYNCNLYRINYAAENEGNNYKYTLGNVFYAIGYCVWGNFPATATNQIKELKPGNYSISVKKNNQTVTGTLKVTATAYTFDWQHDAVMKIEPKVVNR